jgi:hypothetical protein
VSNYRHEVRKFADGGLQLRLPVDLVPPTQYSRLTNVVPVIEGQLRSREGLTLVADVLFSAYANQMARADLASSDIIAFSTVSPAGFRVGDQVTITMYGASPSQGITPAAGAYVRTISGIAPDATPFVFTNTGYLLDSPIPGTNWGAFTRTTGLFFATVTSGGPVSLLPDLVIDNLYRLNQADAGFNGDRIATMAGRVFRAPLPAGNAFQELVRGSGNGEPPSSPNGASGRPMSLIGFRFTEDPASWLIIADQNGMWRYRENPSGSGTATYFFKLGKPAPQVAAIPVANGAGLLNSTGGTDYDWRYTWHDDIVNTDGNPSPTTTGPPDTERPHTATNPDPNVSNADPVGSPSSAFDGSLTTFALAIGTANAHQSEIPPYKLVIETTTQACIFTGVHNPASPPADDVFLNITYDTALSGGTGYGRATITYSFDSGATRSSAVTTTGNTAQTTFVKKAPPGLNYANVRVYMEATGVNAGINQTSTMSLRIYDINLTTASTTGGLSLVNQQALVTAGSPNIGSGANPLNDGRITSIRLWRRGGSLPDAYRLVGTFSLVGLPQDVFGRYQLADNVSDTQLEAQLIMELDNDEPVSSVTATAQPLSFIWGPVGQEARVLGCGDPARPECVYFSKPGNPDCWPPENFIETCDPGTPVIAGCVFNTRTYAFSREGLYELVEGLGTGTTFSPFKTPSAHGLYSPWALATGPAIYFVAKDGIYQSTGGQETSLLEDSLKPLFPTYDSPGQDVHGYEAVDMTQPDSMRLRYHNDELYFGYVGATTGTRQLMIYDILKKRWRAAAYTNGISEIYSEPATTSSLLMGTTGGSVYAAGGDHDPTHLDTIEGVTVTQAITASNTLVPGDYFVRITRITSLGEIGITPEFGPITCDATHAIGIVFPVATPATTTWRIYFGPTGSENQSLDVGTSVAGLTVIITAPGTADTPPTSLTNNVNNLIQCALRTGANDQGAPLNRKQLGNVIFDLDPGGATASAPVTITPYIDGEVQAEAALTVTGSGRQQVPLDLSDFFAFNTEYEVRWARALNPGFPSEGQPAFIIDPVLYQFDTLHFMEPVGVTHWAAQPTSFAFPGYMHCRDAYIAIRSNADVTLTMAFDSTTQTYTVPSTGGQRQKVYVQLASNKGLLYTFALDSAQEFRVYEEDIEIRVKPFLGLLGYSVQRTLGGETGA